MESGTYVNWVLSHLLKKIIVPSDFHGQAEAVKEIQQDDLSGLVDSLTDFAVNSATVDFSIETDNQEFSEILRKWLNETNKEYRGKIPSGIKALAREYFKERWKGSSFPVLKITGWKEIKGISVPSKMFFVDGGSIYAEDVDEKDENLKLFNYDYYLGSKKDKENKLDKGIIFAKAYGRWFDKYPTPYLIKRGIYHNWKLIQSIKNKQSEVLDQIIPYLLLVKKGTEALSIQKNITYDDPKLKKVIEDFQGLIDKMKTTSSNEGAPIRATQFDEEIKHLIPDLSNIFKPELFTVCEKGILAGLGFIDIAEAVSSSRRESILNPKVFIEEIQTGVEDFKQLLKELVFLIREKNDKHIKYINSEFYISASPVKAFIGDEAKNQMRLLWERGQLSNQSYCEIVGEVEYRTEKSRREKEAKLGDEYTMYPHLTRNEEDKGIDFVGKEPVKKEINKNGKPIPRDKIDDKDKYDIGKKKVNLETAPYKTVKELPARVKKNLSPDLQKVFMKVFNNAYQQYKNDSRAFRVAWSVIRKIARKGKDGKWHRKSKKIDGKIQKIKVTQAMMEEVLEKEEKTVIEEAMELRKLENIEKKNKLLDKLLKDEKKK